MGFGNDETNLGDGIKIGEYTLKTFHHRPGIVTIKNKDGKLSEVPLAEVTSALGELFNENL